MIDRLSQLRERAYDYEANDETKRKLSRFVLTSLISPPEAGKLTLANATIKTIEHRSSLSLPETWSLAPVLTTRGRRYDRFRAEGDPPAPLFQTADDGITQANLLRRIESGEVAHYSIRPDDTIYATSGNDFENQYNLLPTMPTSIPAIQRAGFERTESIFITANVSDWSQWLSHRHPDDWAEDAIENLEYAQTHADDLHFVQNSGDKGGIEMAVDEIIRVTLGMPEWGTRERDTETALHLIKTMLGYAKHHAGDKK